MNFGVHVYEIVVILYSNFLIARRMTIVESLSVF